MQKGIGVRTFTWCGRFSFHAYMKRKVKLMGKRDTSRGNRGEKGSRATREVSKWREKVGEFNYTHTYFKYLFISNRTRRKSATLILYIYLSVSLLGEGLRNSWKLGLGSLAGGESRLQYVRYVWPRVW